MDVSQISHKVITLQKDPTVVGGDTLTCGECKKDFRLQELTLFIQHKALNTCRREEKTGKGDQQEEEEEEEGDVRSSKDRSYASLGSPSVSGSGQTEPEEGAAESSVKSEVDVKKQLFTDAETNTVSSSEPKLYSCSFCQKPFETAWSLVQHVQTSHGIQIYSGPEPRRSEPLPKKSSPPSGPPPSFPGLHPAFLHPGSSLYPSPFPPGHPLAGSVLGRGGGEGGHPLAGPGGHHPLLGRPSVPHPSLFPSSVSQHHPLFSPGLHSSSLPAPPYFPLGSHPFLQP